MKNTLSFLLAASFFFTVTYTALAQYGCGKQYGGTCPPPSPILVDKKVGKPTGETKGGLPTVSYIDNLGTNDYRFKADQEIFFQITLKNTTDNQVNNVVMKDLIPSHLQPIKGPGVFDEASRIITINAGNFGAKEEKNYTIKMQVFAKDKLPADKGLFCEVNKAQTWGDNTGLDEDNAQFCIEKEVTGVTTVPSAGPEMGVILIASELAFLGLGMYLRRK